MKDANLDKVKLSPGFDVPDRKPHSLEAGNENYRNPFDLEMINPKKNPLQFGMKQDIKNYDNAVEKLLSGGLELREKMFLAEKNKDLDLSSAIEDLLQSSSNNSGIFDSSKPKKSNKHNVLEGIDPYSLFQDQRNHFASKDAELEALKLRMDYPNDLTRPPARVKIEDVQPSLGVDYSDIKRHKIFIKFFKASNPLLKERLRGKRLSLEVLYPVLASQRPVPAEIYKFLTDEDTKQENFVINQEIDSELDLRRIGVQKLCSNRIGFVIWMKSQDPSTKGKDLEICRGELAFEQLLLSKNFTLKAQIPMRIILEAERMKKVSVSKEEVSKLDVMTSEAGFLNLETNFYNPETLNFQKQTLPSVADNAIDAISHLLGQTSNPETRSFRDLSSNPVCMFLHVKDVRCVPKKDDPSTNRNLYLEHKVYGTPENIQSEIHWNNNSPIMDHRVIIPLDRQSIEMMVN